MINVAGIIHEDGANGPGLRCTIFVQGCDHKCKGCHSAHTWKFGAGTDMSVDELVDECNKNPLETGITLSGGDPVYQYEPLTTVLERVDPNKHKNTRCYTLDSLKRNLSYLSIPKKDLVDSLNNSI